MMHLNGDRSGLSNRHCVLLGAAISAMLCSAQLQAQERATLDEVVVTGQKVTRSLQDTYESVEILNAESLERLGAASVYDALRGTANVIAPPAFGEDFSIRGVEFSGVTEVTGSQPTSTVFVDDVPQGRDAALFSIASSWDVDQIEVFRSPIATTQGRNSLAGGIVIRTAPAEFEWGGRARVAVADKLDRNSYAAALTGPIVADQVAFRLSASRDKGQSSGRFADPQLDSLRDYERDNVRAKLRIEPASLENLTINLTASRLNVNDVSMWVTNRERRLNEDGSVVSPIVVNRADTLAARADWEVNAGLTLTALSSYQQQDYKDNSYDSGSVARIGISKDYDANHEIRMTYAGGALSAVGGVFYGRSSLDFTGIVPGLGELRNYIERKTYAGFGEARWRVRPAVELTVGARVERQKYAVTDQNFFSGQVATSGDASTVFLPKIALAYDLTPDRTLALTVQRAYRGGSAGQRFVDGTGFTYAPEYTTNYELALRTRSADRRLTFNANVYYTDWKDQQVSVVTPLDPDFLASLPPDPDLLAFVEFLAPFNEAAINAGKSRLYGVELSLGWNPDERWSFGASVGTIDSKFDSFVTPFGDFTGNEFAAAPKFSATASASYRHPGGFFASASASHRTRQWDNAENTRRIDAYTVTSARVGYEYRSLQVYLDAQNLFGDTYILGYEDDLHFSVSDPRVVMLGLEARF